MPEALLKTAYTTEDVLLMLAPVEAEWIILLRKFPFLIESNQTYPYINMSSLTGQTLTGPPTFSLC